MNRVRATLVSIGFLIAGADKSQGAELPECNTITESMGYKISNVRILGSWVPDSLKQAVSDLLPVGSTFNPSTIDPALKLVEEKLRGQVTPNTRSIKFGFGYSEACPIYSDEEKLVEITIKPFYVDLDLIDTGKAYLPVPSIGTPSFSISIPNILKPLTPAVAAFSDRGFGGSIALSTSFDLLDIDQSDLKNPQHSPLNVVFNGRQSFTDSFYNYDGSLIYSNASLGKRNSWSGMLNYFNAVNPYGNTDSWLESGSVEASISRKFSSGLLKGLSLGVSGQHTNSAQDEGASLPISSSNSQNSLQLSLLTDLRIPESKSRLGLWSDFSSQDQKGDFQKVVTQFGIHKEVGSGHDTVGIEFLAGGGYIWGNPPQHNRFFGGFQPSNFLYDSPTSNSYRQVANGPLLRSFGQFQAGIPTKSGDIIGATQFLGSSLSIAIPIPGWSKPLLPPEVEILDDPLPKYFKTLSKRYLNQSLIEIKTSQGVSEDEFKFIENSFNNDVIPAIDYLADKANLYSIKPVLFADAAYLGSALSGMSNYTYVGIGGGIQANLVNASLELGYMQNVAPSQAKGEGNFFLKFYIRDLF